MTDRSAEYIRSTMTILGWIERAARFGLNVLGFESRFLETRVGRLHYYDGSGRGLLPPIAIIHGIGASAASYGPLLARVRPEVKRVIAPDSPGHGFSEAPRPTLTPESMFQGVSDLLDRELAEPTVLFGNSLGGGLAVRYALERRDRVRALILSSPAGAALNDEDMLRLLETFRHDSRADAADFVRRLYHRAPWYAPMFASSVKALFDRPELRDFLSAIRPNHAFRAEELRSLTMPVLLLWGRSDKIMPRACFEFYRAHLPEHAVIEEPEEFGHCPYLDRTDMLAARMVRFMREAA
jgi:pimeloyl-ACP methyl ester carboxylesterase